MSVPEIIISGITGAVAGGAVSYFVAIYTLKNTDLSSRIDELCRDIREMEDKGCAYWQLAPNDPKVPTLEVQIRGISKRMGKRLRFLAEKYWILEFAAEDELIRLRQAVTLGEFGQKGRQADPSRYGAIQRSANNFENALRRARSSLW